MGEATQNILPMNVESVSRSGTTRLSRGAFSGVRNKGPADRDFFHGEGDARRGGSITGVVTKIRHANPENGFHILRVKLDESASTVSFVGACEPVAVGDRVEAVGQWERHARFGQQLKARFIRVMTPSTGDEIHAFLKGGGVKGVGKRSADKLREHFGDRLAQVMTSPTTLMASGINEKQARLLADAWTQRSTQTEILAFLQSLSIGPATADKVIKKYGERTRQRITSNPYDVARDVAGLGFKTADQMALAMSFDRRDTRRVDAAILHAMHQLGRDGHCACPRGRIMKDVRKLLGIDDRDIRAGIDRLVDKKLLIEEENGGSQVIYEANVLRCEEELAARIVSRVAPVALPDEIDAMIAKAAADVGIDSLHEHQALAVKRSLAARFSVITGGPGAGKTSSLEVLLRVFEATHPEAKIALCAPTGRAAQRMAESTGREASTIHRLLEWSPGGGGFQRGEDNPIDADFVVADEASMLDIWLSRDLLRAVRPDAVIVLVGDVDQLPSVGAGRVLGDIIDSGAGIPVTRLTRIFRQGAGSQIAETAQQINAGRLPRIGKPDKSTDMWAAWNEDPEDSLPRLSKMVSQIAPQLGYDPLSQVQVLTAGHQGVLGTINLNLVLQEALNPARPDKPEVEIAEKVFRKGDRVIQMSNDYDLDVFNGDIGQIVEIRMGGRKTDMARITVAFDEKEVEYGASDARNLSLAYAISVHKSQGSEFPVVIFAPTTQHYTMLRKTLIYTAVTRAKKLCVLIGSERAAKIAVKNTDRGRVTGLHRRLTVEQAELARLTGG